MKNNFFGDKILKNTGLKNLVLSYNPVGFLIFKIWPFYSPLTYPRVRARACAHNARTRTRARSAFWFKTFIHFLTQPIFPEFGVFSEFFRAFLTLESLDCLNFWQKSR